MPSRDDLKRIAAEAIDGAADRLITLAQDIGDHPEPGFKEHRTARQVEAFMRSVGLAPKTGIALTGLKAVVTGGSPGPTVAVMGELDSLIVPQHPKADPQTGAAHACGHHAQLGMLMGVAVGLLAPGVLPALAGRVAFIAVPAEEYIEIEWRNELRKQGKVEFLGGKPEFIRLGELDDVDMAMMTHTTSSPEEGRLSMSGTNNGIVAKFIQFHGRAAHAGGAPHMGINALNAAMIALAAIHANRETFKDEDTVRIHPIITKGGVAVSSVPADVRMETFVRARTMEAVLDANAKVDRCLRAGALAVGGKVTITTMPGYLPLITDPHLAEVYRANAVALVGEGNYRHLGHRTGSTDMGDVSHLMPVIHPYAGGATGIGHGADYLVQDYHNAVITAAKAMCWTVIDLLADGAVKGREIKARHKPRMTKAEYLRFMRSLFSERTYEN
ncbi:MAG: amidohydrolase [Dehalococcoidia bacterium]|nr:amidohydrolase [Dehalococcoidia bacterium]MDW8120206.1 amidohydrolase [Chloroflexota bacterium]